MLIGDGKQPRIPLFLPNSIFVVVWEISFSIVIVLYFCLSLFGIAFRVDADDRAVNGFASTIFVVLINMIDTLISINTCFIRNGKLITNRWTNFRNYWSSWMMASDMFVLGILYIRLLLL